MPANDNDKPLAVLRSDPTPADLPLDPSERHARYVAACERIGLPAATHPLVVVTRGGRETFHATARATDELAARHRLRRELIEGPRVMAHGKSTLAYAVCRATHPDGRTATAAVSLPFTNPEDALMVCETRAKRIATLRVLGLEDFSDKERDVIPSGFTPIEPVDIAVVSEGPTAFAAPTVPLGEHPMRDQPARAIAATEVPFGVVPMRAVQDPSHAAALAVAVQPAAAAPLPVAADPLSRFLADAAKLANADAAVALWLARRGEIAPLSPLERSAAWNGLCARVGQLGGMADPKGWLKSAVAARTAATATATTRNSRGG